MLLRSVQDRYTTNPAEQCKFLHPTKLFCRRMIKALQHFCWLPVLHGTPCQRLFVVIVTRWRTPTVQTGTSVITRTSSALSQNTTQQTLHYSTSTHLSSCTRTRSTRATMLWSLSTTRTITSSRTLTGTSGLFSEMIPPTMTTEPVS